MAQKGPSFSEWFAARQLEGPAGPAGSMAPAATSASSAAVSLSSLFGASSSPAAAQPAVPDVECKGAAPTGGGAGQVPSFFGPALALLSSMPIGAVRVGQVVGLGGIAPGIPAAPVVEEWTCGMNSVQRFQAFGILLLTSLLLYISAIFVFLPMVIFMPSKCVPLSFFVCMLAWASLARSPPSPQLPLNTHALLPTRALPDLPQPLPLHP